ncbi:MAG: NIPSNAP family protein [Balneolales bacterium]
MKKAYLLSFICFTFLISCSQPDAETEDTVDNQFYELRIYDAAPGRIDDLHSRFRDHTLRLFEKYGMTNIGYWVPVQNTDSQIYYVLAYPSREARDASWEAFNNDPEWIKAKEASEANGPIVTKGQSIFLKATDYSPEIKPITSENPRTFEFRIYKASTGNLDRLHARFRNHTVDLFSKHGMKHFAYWSPVDDDKGADDTLIYFIYHDNEDARDTSFDGFRSDQEWIKVAKASEEAAGRVSLTANVKSILMMPTDYSPTQ